MKSGFVTELVPEGVFSTRVTFGTQQPIFVQIKQRSDGVTTASSHVNFCCFILEVGLHEDASIVQAKLVVRGFIDTTTPRWFNLLYLWRHNVVLIKRLCVAHYG